MIELLPTDAVEDLRATLSKKRYRHSERVMLTSFRIADGWESNAINRTDLAWASLFHDCCKELNAKQQEALLSEGVLPCGEELMSSPPLVHGPLGALYVKTRYGIDTPDVLTAITYHSTGHPDLSPMGWSIYIADFIEPGRKYIENHEELVRQSQEDPLRILRRISEWRLRMFREKGKVVHPIAHQVEEFLHSIQEFPAVLAS